MNPTLPKVNEHQASKIKRIERKEPYEKDGDTRHPALGYKLQILLSPRLFRTKRRCFELFKYGQVSFRVTLEEITIKRGSVLCTISAALSRVHASLLY